MHPRSVSRHLIELVDAPIDVGRVMAAVTDPAAGAVDLFVGTTRNHHGGRPVLRLAYEAYVPMARAELEKIAVEAVRQWGLLGVAVVHRVGVVEIGEASVVIACSAAHRAEAFAACRFIIDTLKRDVPIWKKEYFADGQEWIGPADGGQEETKGS